MKSGSGVSMGSHDLIILPDEHIQSRIFLIRGKKVMFDRDLAELYGVETKKLNEAVKRNHQRFPEDFMFRLAIQERHVWQEHLSRSQFATLNRGQNIKYSPTVFTEQGIAMLASVLRSDRAILVNIQIIRTFIKLRELMATNKELREKIEQLERKYDSQFKAVFDVIKRLIAEDIQAKPLIGFHE